MSRNKKIIIVDDDTNISELMTLYLNKEGYETHTFENGRLALKAFGEIAPDLLLLDIMMPEMDGIELMAKLKKEPSIENTQVIGMSGHFSRKQDDYDDIGFASFLPKPINFRKLINVLLELTK